MRSIATFKEEKLALRFWNYLQGEEIESALEEDGKDAWAIWVIDEEKIQELLQTKSAKDAAISQFIELLTNCEMARYAPFSHVENMKQAV